MEKWPSVDPGELRHLITIQRPVESQGSDGALMQAWVTHVQVYAKIDPYGGGEKWVDAALQTSNFFKIWMRYCAGVTTKMRISFDKRIFDIKNVENVMERNVLLVLTCLERLYDESGRRLQ